MTLVRWKPFRDYLGMHETVNKMFKDEYLGEQENNANTWSPVTDIYEDSDKYLLKMEVPGLSNKDINIEFNGDILTVKGERKDDRETNEENYHRVESYTGKFSRSFSMPKTIAADKIKADMKNGIISIQVPKVEEVKPKAITINVA